MRRHQAGRVLRANDVDFDTDIGSGVQDLARRVANCVLVEDLFDGRQSLSFVRDLFGGRKNGRHINSQRLGRKGLKFLAEDDRVRTSGSHELHLLRSQGFRDVAQFFVAVVQLFLFGVDGQDGAGIDRILLFKDRFVVFIHDSVSVGVDFLDPIF